jgi:hypothetical protein
MLHRMIAVTAFLLLAPCLAKAQSVQKAMEKFGLPGIWAVDCSKPAGPTNFFAHYTVSAADRGMLTYDGSDTLKKSSYIIHDAKLLGDRKIELEEEFLADHSFLDLILTKSEDQIRVISSRRNDGKVLIADGRFQPEGDASLWFTRCSN